MARSSALSKKSKSRDDRAQRRKNLARCIDLAWASLRTHLADTVSVTIGKSETRGNERWNAKCVRDYGEIIYVLSVELHALTTLDFPDCYEDLQKTIPR